MFSFPHGIDGWLTEDEGLALSVFARGRTVLEIGSYKGKSTVCLAQTAKSVTCIDPFDGRATPEPAETFGVFQDNLAMYGIENVTALQGTTDEMGPQLEAGFDLVFIDGGHAYTNVRNDTEWALRLLKPSGMILYHDYRSGVNLGVDQAVNDLLADGGQLLMTQGTVAVVIPPARLLTGEASTRVVMAMPHRGSMNAGSARAFFGFPSKLPSHDLLKLDMASSVLTLNFNRMWAEALNAREHGFTHFAMLHDDVCPDPGWLDILLAELDEHKADVMSVVVPIKSVHGLTSTALGNVPPRNIFRPLRRITMRELYELPPTFSRADIDLDGPSTLFINTGCWVCDLRKPWVEKNCFRNVERLVKAKNGWKADCMSEDWAFSVDLDRWGAKVMATRKVPLYHDRQEYHNKAAWGSWDTDREYTQRIEATQGVGS